MNDRFPHIVILGGGFGGLDAARALAGAPVRVTLLDRHNYHLFQPLLYQVATASLSPGDIASPIRWVLRRQKNVTVLLANVRDVDVAAKQVILDDGREIAYDFLIVATGAAHSYFGTRRMGRTCARPQDARRRAGDQAPRPDWRSRRRSANRPRTRSAGCSPS